MIRVKNKKTHVFMLVLLLILGIGFAALAATLKINGTITIDSAKWDVHFENVSITEGSVTATTVPTSDDTTTTEMTYAVDFTQPGDFYEFTVDIANDGTIDAMVNLVTNKVYAADGETEKQLPAYLKSTVTYVDGAPISKNQLLSKQTSEKIKVRVEFRSDVEASDLPSTNETTIFKFSSTFKQADENATPVRASFDKSSWNDIVTAYNNGEISQLQQDMENGVTREVQLDLDNDGTAETTAHLRIANLSTPTECGTEGFSQTACGLVIEFADIITTHRMNPFDNSGNSNGDGNRGGWEYSDMRAFLNNGKYLEGETGEIDYSSTGIYSALPSELRSKIIETKVVSGHGSKDRTNFTTTDKIYLLDPREIYGTSYTYTFDTAKNYERQLDYYKAKGVTTSNKSETIKKNLSGSNSIWWLRSANSDSRDFFYYTYSYGGCDANLSAGTHGVAPAFRIG